MLEKYFNKKRRGRSLEIEEITESRDKPPELETLEDDSPGSGIRFSRFLVFGVLLFLVLRVFYLQVVRGEYYADLARENRLRGIVIKAPRGLVFDRNGKKMVQNIPSFDLVAGPAANAA